MQIIRLSDKAKFVIKKIKFLGFRAKSAFLFDIVIDKEVIKTKTSFLTNSDASLNNKLFFCNCNI